MKKFTKTVNTLAVLSMLAGLAAKTAVTARFAEINDDRGDVPGWAIASGAACVLAALVYAAYSAVINKWITKIN